MLIRVLLIKIIRVLSQFLETMEDYYQYDPWNTAFIQEGKSKIEELAKKPSCDVYQTYCNSDDLKSFYHLFLDYKNLIRSNGSQLSKIWMTFLDMTEIMLNTIHATRAGNWVVLLESYRDIIPYTFAYDHLLRKIFNNHVS